VGATLTYAWNLAGNKLSFNNTTAGKTTFQTSYQITLSGASEINVGFDYGGTTSPGDKGLIKGSNAALGTDLAGGDLYIAPGRGTGASVPSCLYLQTPTVGTTGTTLQTLTTRLTINGLGNIGFNTTSFGTTMAKGISVGNGTAPSTAPADSFQMWSQDIVAGNAAPYFMTETGDIIKLYKNISTADLGTVLSNCGLRTAGTDYPLNTSGSVQFTGGTTITGGISISGGNLTITNSDIALATTTGTKIGTATNQKLGFFNSTPVVQATHVTDPTDLATSITAIKAVISRLETFGLFAASS